MKRILVLANLLCIAFLAQANNVKITNLTTTVTGSVTKANFTIQWDNSWRGGPANNYDAVWVFLKYKDERGFWSHIDLTNTNITLPGNLAADTTADHKGIFIYRSQDGQGNIAASNVSVGILQKPGKYDVKVFGIEMVYIPKGSFYLGHSGGNTSNFGDGNTYGTVPFQITSATPPGMGTAAGQLYDSRGSGFINQQFPTGYNAFYMMKYELSQAGYRDFLNTPAGFLNNILPERTDLTNANYNTVGTKLFPFGFRNNLAVARTSSTDHIGANGNTNSAYDEEDDGEWVAANFLYWSDAAAFLDWAALRPMTEFEYEKAVNGPDAVNYPQFASGTYIQINDETPVSNPLTSAESAKLNANTNNINTMDANVGGPLRSGWAATATSNRMTSGASYYGVMDLSGNLWEPVVTVANAAGRSFTGKLGDGSISGLTGRANVNNWPGTQNITTAANGAGEILQLNTAGISKRGGSFAVNLYSAVTDVNYDPAVVNDAYPTTRANTKDYGCRGVRQQTSTPQQ